ncbi:sulfotransferase family 2 domain-containing protein [Litoreibacter roseus]|uniref:Sulfotransferase family protein n=1 Tax=Litoreibacter roseus TaxID=2601869 RepID=A0A6N6JGV7_9RHOB|nr:sulfotransferase family 2 domain-containing protein [Litoreibacter roseus]GFE65446.1 hypothetical protein KIN_25200 [Litoreibacter roseus]
MIISRGRGYIFVHIPKTGGTSMAAALENRAMGDDILIGDTTKAKRRRHRLEGQAARGRIWKHMTLDDCVGLISAEEVAAFKVFTMVRNPWDRIVSYYHWLTEQSFDHPAVHLAKAQDFSGFLNAPHTIQSLSANPYGSYVSLNGREQCDLFVRLEHLEEDLPRLENLLDLRIGSLPHLNTSARAGSYRPFYSDADCDLVARIAAPDIARFGYAF